MATKKSASKTTPAKEAADAPAVKKAAAKKAPAKSAAGTAANISANAQEPTHAEIARLAHKFWQERGGKHGSHEEDWARAERELRGGK